MGGGFAVWSNKITQKIFLIRQFDQKIIFCYIYDMYIFEQRSQGKSVCDRAGCDKAGEYRAPKSHTTLDEYYWFCLEHVRDYNKKWSYNAGKTAEEIEAEIRSDVLGGRPTWARHTMAGAKIYGGNLHDPLNIKKETFTQTIKDGFHGLGGDFFAEAPHDSPPNLPQDIRQAYAVLGASYDCTAEDLKTLYKKKAKQYHPDLNKGDKKAENQFKTINNAYKTITDYWGENP